MILSLLHRREAIIISTVEIIDEVGFHNLSTKMIAQKQSISEGTLFRHFKNKIEIIKGVIDHFSKFDDAIIVTHKNAGLNARATIKNFILSYVEYYENYPAITVLVQLYDSLLAEKELRNQIEQIINKKFDFVYQTIQEGQLKGEIKQEINALYAAHLISGGTRNLCLKWRMEGYCFSLKKETLEMLDMFLKQLE